MVPELGYHSLIILAALAKKSKGIRFSHKDDKQRKSAVVCAVYMNLKTVGLALQRAVGLSNTA